MAGSFTVNAGASLDLAANSIGWSLYGGSITVNAGGVVQGGFQGLSGLALNGGTLTGTGGGFGGQTFAFNSNVTVGGSSASTMSAVGNSGFGLTFNSVAAARTFTVANASGDAVADLVVSVPLQNSFLSGSAASLVKAGVGTMLLSATSTYSGTTAVNAGTLLVNGRLANTSAVSVAAGAVLGGTGSIASGVTVSGILSPGASPGVLTMNSLTLEPVSTTLMEINGTTRGSLYDGIDLSTAGGLTYGGTLSLSFGSVFDDNTAFSLFSFSGAPAGGLAGIVTAGAYGSLTFSGSGGVWTSNEVNGQTMTFTESTGSLVIVPEPAASALACIGLVLVGWSVARRRLVALD